MLLPCSTAFRAASNNQQPDMCLRQPMSKSWRVCLLTASERPHIQNDTITINHRFATDHIIKLSISHALSQVRWLQHANGTH